MAKGNELGDYSLRMTTVTVKPGLSGSVVLESNWEGSATGYGTVIGTAMMVGADRGTFTYYSVVYNDAGERFSGISTGVYESIGVNIWRTDATIRFNDGDNIIAEGTIDLACHTWKGKFYEVV